MTITTWKDRWTCGFTLSQCNSIEEERSCVVIVFHSYRHNSYPRISSAPNTTLLNASKRNKEPKYPERLKETPEISQRFQKYLFFLPPKPSRPNSNSNSNQIEIPATNCSDPVSVSGIHALTASIDQSQNFRVEVKEETHSPSGPRPSSLLIPQRPRQPSDFIGYDTMLCPCKPQ
jgi:hypothetical protein